MKPQLVYINIATGSVHSAPAAEAAPPEVIIKARSQNDIAFVFFTAPAPFNVTATQSDDTFKAVAHGLTDGQRIVFPTLVGGIGLKAATVAYYVISATANTFQVSLTPGGSAVNFGANVEAGTCRLSTLGEELDGWTGGKLVVKHKPETAVLILDTTIEAEGAGDNVRYIASWTNLTCSSPALLTYLADQTLPRDCWCELEWTYSDGTYSRAFPIKVAPSFSDPDDGAPDPAVSASWVWLKSRLAAGDNVTFEVNEETKIINISTGAGSGGADGREIELQAGTTHIQWRYVGEADWTNLIPKTAITGPAGAAGTNGTNGITGPTGQSAYEVAVANGFVGNVTAWLASLVGPTGATPTLASQVEAEAGTDNTKAMTPLRTAQAIAALAGEGGGGGQLPGTAYVSSSVGVDEVDSGTAAKPFASLQAAYDSGARSFFIEGTVGDLTFVDSISLFGLGRDRSIVQNLNIKGEPLIFGNGPNMICVNALQTAYTRPDTPSKATGDTNGSPGENGANYGPFYVEGIAIGTVTILGPDGGYGGDGGDQSYPGGSLGYGGLGGTGGEMGGVTFQNCTIGGWASYGGQGGNGGQGGTQIDEEGNPIGSFDGGQGGSGGGSPVMTFRNCYISGNGTIREGYGGLGGGGSAPGGSNGTSNIVIMRFTEQLGSVGYELSGGTLLLGSSFVDNVFYASDI